VLPIRGVEDIALGHVGASVRLSLANHWRGVDGWDTIGLALDANVVEVTNSSGRYMARCNTAPEMSDVEPLYVSGAEPTWWSEVEKDDLM